MSNPELTSSADAVKISNNYQQETEKFKQLFQYKLQVRKPLQWMLQILGVVICGEAFLYIGNENAIPSWAIPLLFALGVVLLTTSKDWVIPKCTSCQNCIQLPPAGPYCPTCGNDHLQKARWGGAYCMVCKNHLTHNRGGRTYKIKYCTHCGVHLSDRGIWDNLRR